MGRVKSKNVDPCELDFTAMIDVIFQLMIFFMCTIKFKSLEGKLFSYLPKDVGLQNTSVPDPNLDEVRIKLVYDERKPLNTKITLQTSSNSSSSAEVQIPDWETLSNQVAGHYARIMSINAKVPFIIDPQSKVPLQSIVHAMDACRKANITDIRFAAKSPVTEELKR